MTKRPAIPDTAGKITRTSRAMLALAAALLLAWSMALPAEGQARRTRPEGSSASSGSTSGSASSGRTTVSRPPSSAGRTRPSGRTGGTTVIDNDRRPPRQYYRPGYGYGYYPPSWSYYHWYPYRYSWWLGYWGWYGWWDYYPYHGPPTYAYGRPYNSDRRAPGMGALDTDLKPGNTQIYVDGRYVGTADDFDGWPRYLWLQPGDYHFIFWHPDRRPVVREYKITPDVVIDVEDRLEPGEATPVEELFPPSTERRDARIRRNVEQRRRVEEERAGDAGAPGWRQRSERIRRSTAGEEWEGDGGEDGDGFASLSLRVEPGDASVYLDGRFVGTADDLARLRRGLTLDPGAHTLSVVRPGYAQQEVEIVAEDDETIELEVVLERASR